MYGKRPLSGLDNASKRSKKPTVDDAIARAKARLLQRQQSAENLPSAANNSYPAIQNRLQHDKKEIKPSQDPSTNKLKDAAVVAEGKGGLSVKLHPLLRDMATVPSLPKNHNPIKQQLRPWFDQKSINPYLNQTDFGAAKKQHKARPLMMNPQGKYIAKGDEMRNRMRQQEEERLKNEETKQKGLAADLSIGEDHYKQVYPPMVEWWDRPYLKGAQYGTELVLDNENAPISLYIQHPVLIPAPWEQLLGEAKPMHLTKKEMKRIRRNNRQQIHKDKQDRIKLGLDPPPPPKVKLSNLMNVLTNEAIRDPTGVEMRVKAEVEERFQKHMEQNEARKLTKEQKHEKIRDSHERDLLAGYFTSVYRIEKLSNPQHLFKVDINAKQMDLVGMVLLNPKFNLVVVEGGSKGIKFYNKLLTKRISWTDQAANIEECEDLSKNKCTLLWEGQVKQLKFKKWSIMHSRDEDEALAVLQRFGSENYWRQAAGIP